MAVYPRLNRLGPQGSVLQLLAAQQMGDEHPLASVPASENMAQPTGSLADDGRPDSSVLLGTGMGPARFGRAPSQFQRSVVRRGGKLLEAHSYGPGTETKYFERKNPAVLRAAAAQAAQQQLGQPVASPSGLSPRDEELLRMLLGNPTLHR
jgi:hypothetical protein